VGQSGFEWSLEHLLDRPRCRIDRLVTHLQVVLARRADGCINRQYLGDTLRTFTQQFYVCGPEESVTDMKKLVEELGGSPAAIVVEECPPAVSATTGASAAPGSDSSPEATPVLGDGRGDNETRRLRQARQS